MKKRTFRSSGISGFLAAVLLGLLVSACGENNKNEPGKKPAARTGGDGFTAGPPAEMISPADRNSISAETKMDSLTSLRLMTPAAQKEEKAAVQVTQDHIHRMTETEAEAANPIRRRSSSEWEIRSVAEKNPGAMSELLKDPAAPEGTRLVWQPQEMPTLLSPVRLPDAQISPDSSVIAFVETTGAAEGPFGSRLILMNTADWTILRIIDIPGRRIGKIVWIPGTAKIAAVCHAQPELEQQNGLAVFDLQSGKETGFIRIPEGMGDTAFLADSRQRIILSHPTLPELVLIPADDLVSAKPAVIHTEQPNAVAALSPDGKYLAVVPAENGKRISVYKTADLQPLSTSELKNAPSLHCLFFLGGIDRFYLCGKMMQESAILRNGQSRKLEGVTAGIGLAEPDGNTVYHAQVNGNRISVIDVRSGAERRCIETNKAEPRLKKPGTIAELFLIPAIRGLAVLDTQGNFYLLSIGQGKGKYGERAVIFQRSGISR